MITNPLTYEQKEKLYWANKWTCPVPGIPTGRWEEKDWIAWIDKHGEWSKNDEQEGLCSNRCYT